MAGAVSDPSPPPAHPATASAGLVLGERYRLVDLLAIGGMAEVWQAEDLLLTRRVAIKVLHRHLAADPGFVQRFRTEAVAAARLHHPGIVAVFDTCSDDGVEAIVLELVQGHTLREHLDAHGPLVLEDALDVTAAVADALAVAHAAGLVHRDVKPANILLCDDDRVMITDFGIAKVVDTTDKTATGTMLGSVKYLSPEQVEGATVDGRSDLFSLGIVLFEMLTGRPPWLAETPAATALARLHTPATPVSTLRPDLGPRVDALVASLLAVDPSRRPTDARTLRQQVLALRADPGPVAPAADPDATRIDPVPPAAAPAAPTTVAATAPAAPTTVAATAPAAPSAPATSAAPSPPPAPARSSRRWIVGAVVAALVLGALGITAALVWDTGTGREIRERVGAPPATSGPLVVTATAYDPEGTGPPGENDADAPLTTDGDPATSWTSEGYNERDLGNKRGVGLVLALDGPHELDRLEVASTNVGWAASIYLADGPAADLEGWGDPVDEAADLGAEHTFDLGGGTASHVLVWVTDLGEPDPLGSGDRRHRAVIDEVQLDGR